MLQGTRSQLLVFPILLAGALLLSGCTSARDYLRNGFKVGPNYRPPPAPVEYHWIDAADVRVREQSQMPCYWWTVFNDPVLDSLVAEAYAQNLTLREAGYRVLQARAQLGITRGNVFPQVQDAFGGYTRQGLAGDFSDQWNFGFSLAWELDFWGRFRRAVQSAEDSLEASVADYDDVLVTLVGDVADNYVLIRTDQERIRLLQENIAIQKAVLEIGEERLRTGTITSVDVEQLRSNLLQNQAQIEQLYIDLRHAANRLCILMGMPPWDLQERLGAGPIPVTPPEVVVGIPADLVRRRPDVRRAEREAAAQAEQIGIAVASLYPAFSVNGTLNYQAQAFSDLFRPESFTGSVGPAFQWDILNYGRLASNIWLQDARLQELIAFYQNTVLEASGEVEDGLVTFLRAQQRARLLDQSANAARKAVLAIREQLQVGRIDFNQYAVIQQSLIQQQDLWAQARGQIAGGLIQVYRALGGGWELRSCGSPVRLPQPEGPASEAGSAVPGTEGLEQMPVPGDAPLPPEPPRP